MQEADVDSTKQTSVQIIYYEIVTYKKATCFTIHPWKTEWINELGIPLCYCCRPYILLYSIQVYLISPLKFWNSEIHAMTDVSTTRQMNDDYFIEYVSMARKFNFPISFLFRVLFRLNVRHKQCIAGMCFGNCHGIFVLSIPTVICIPYF